MTKKDNILRQAVYILKNMKWADEKSRVKFNFLAGINRTIIPAHVTKLAESIKKISILRPIICAEMSFITGKLELYVLDGQHTLTSLLRLGLPIPYVVIPIKDKKELIESIAMLNASSKNWCLLDYVIAWSSLVPDYLKLNTYYERYDFELSILAAVLGEHELSHGSNSTRFIKTGEFRIKNEEHNVKMLNHLTDVLSVVGRMSRYENRYFCQEYIKFLRNKKGYNHETFLKGLKRNSKLFSVAISSPDKLKDLFARIS